jgi:hypothetical protein
LSCFEKGNLGKNAFVLEPNLLLVWDTCSDVTVHLSAIAIRVRFLPWNYIVEHSLGSGALDYVSASRESVQTLASEVEGTLTKGVFALISYLSSFMLLENSVVSHITLWFLPG